MTPELLTQIGPLEGTLRWQRLGVDGDRHELLGAPAVLADAAGVLAGAGFEELHGYWIRFSGARCDVVRLVDPSGWGLPAAEITRLFDGPAGLAPLAAPEVLLIAAQRLGASPAWGPEPTGLAVAEAADEAAWSAAKARLPHWGMPRALELLQRTIAGGLLLPHDRDVALQELTSSRGAALPAVRADARLPTLGPDGGRAVISISGLDGAGKSSQALALRAALLALGVDAVVEWSRLAVNPALDVVAAPVKAALKMLRRRRASTSLPPAAAQVDPAAALRSRFGAVGATWAAVVAVVNALAQRRTTTPHLRGGRVVIRDRYVLDSVVQLRHTYGAGRGMAAQEWLVRRLSPRPLVAFLLEVDGAEAYRRKPEQWTAEQLDEQARLYATAADELGVLRLDGAQPRDELAAVIARTVWMRAVS